MTAEDFFILIYNRMIAENMVWSEYDINGLKIGDYYCQVGSMRRHWYALAFAGEAAFYEEHAIAHVVSNGVVFGSKPNFERESAQFNRTYPAISLFTWQKQPEPLHFTKLALTL